MSCRLIALAAVLSLTTLVGGPAGASAMPAGATASAQGATSITFIDSGQSLGQGVSFSPTLGDLDGDHDLDLFVTNYWTANKVWMNNGSGYFTNSGQNFGATSGHGVALGDLDGDNDLDAFLVYNQASDWVLLNDGSGRFTDTGQSLGYTNGWGDLEVGDLDSDGDLDVIVSRPQGYGGTAFYFNVTPSAGVGRDGPLPLTTLLGQNRPNPFAQAPRSPTGSSLPGASA